MNKRTALGSARDIEQRLEILESRIPRQEGYILPGRLSSAAQEISDWDNATQPGFYWGAAGAANSPGSANSWAGIVYLEGGSGTVIQTAHQADTSNPVSIVGGMRRYRVGAAWTSWVPVGGSGGLPSVPPFSEAFAPILLNYTAGMVDWEGVPGLSITMTDLPYNLIVTVTLHSMVSTDRDGNGVALGINAAGATTVTPELEQKTGLSRYYPARVVPASDPVFGQHLAVSKSLTLNPGTTTLTTQILLDIDDTGFANLLGARMEVMPHRWA